MWSDKIVVMEEEQVGRIDDSLSTYVKIVNLGIVDMYDYGAVLREVVLNRFSLLYRFFDRG